MIRTIIACGIVLPMAAGSTPVLEPQIRPGITLATVIAELQFIFQFVIDDKGNPRIAGLLEQAQLDLAEVASKIIHGDDPLVLPDPIDPPPPPG
jgi:hypothetical protein